MRISIVVSTVLCLGCACVYGKEIKIGFVDAEEVFDKYQKTQDLNAKLQQEGKEKIAERKAMVEEINKLKDEADLLRDEAKREKEELVDKKVKELYQFEESVKRETMKKQVRLQEEILGEVKEALREIGRSEGYDIIFTYTKDDIGYHAEGLDLAGDVVKFLNKKYQKKK
jgi:outer membrane protein